MTAEIRDDILHGCILFLLLTAIYAYFVVIIPYQAALVLTVFSLGVAVIGLILYKPVLYIYLYLLSFLLYLDNPAGIQITDIIFFVLTLVFAGFFTIPYLITNKAKIESPPDYWYLLFVASLIFGFFNGLLRSTDKLLAVSDMTYFIGLSLYFPIKANLDNKTFRKTLTIILGIVLFYVLIRNFINYREIVLQSIKSWQVEDARVPKNEVIILSGCLISLIFYLHIKKILIKALVLFIYGLFIVGLILTQSRGYWLGFAAALLFLAIIADKKKRWRLILVHIAIVLSATAFLLTFFNHELLTILKGLVLRFSSIGTVSNVSRMGSSLLERVYEAEQIIHLIAENPIIGYGLGTTYHRYFILFATYIKMTYIHDGYLGMWFKLGLPGLISIVAFNIITLKYAISLYRKSENKAESILYMSIGAIQFAMFVCNVANDQYLTFESIALMTIMGAIVSKNHSLKSEGIQKNRIES